MRSTSSYPTIIQGGMGIAVSSWQLAKEVSIAGELGVISGTATVTLNGESFQKVAGETVDVAIGDLHRIANQGSAELVFIEVQTGSYFGEDDIERIEDDYSR